MYLLYGIMLSGSIKGILKDHVVKAPSIVQHLLAHVVSTDLQMNREPGPLELNSANLEPPMQFSDTQSCCHESSGDSFGYILTTFYSGGLWCLLPNQASSMQQQNLRQNESVNFRGSRFLWLTIFVANLLFIFYFSRFKNKKIHRCTPVQYIQACFNFHGT